MLELLRQIVNFIWELLPRPTIVGPCDRAVCFWFGRFGRVKGPGWYVIWPLIQYWRVRPVVSQICETAIIAATDASGHDWQLRLAIEYRLHDVLEYEVSTFNSQNQLEQIGGYSLVALVTSRTTEQLQSLPIEELCSMIRNQIMLPVMQYGITVIDVRSVMAVRCRSFFLSHAERLAD